MWSKYLGIIIVILLGGVLIAGQIALYSVQVIDPPGKIYLVNGTDIHLYCTGQEKDKQPTVIIVAGSGNASPLYYPLQERLSKTIMTCSYDRAGLGWSEANDVPANAKNMADELYQLLQTAKIDGPIILAGHSLGGTVSLVYSAQYNEQVAGIAFIDSAHHDLFKAFGKDFNDVIDSEFDKQLENFWLVELLAKLGILNLIGVIPSGDPELIEHAPEIFEYLDTWTPRFKTISSEISQFNNSLNQGKKAFYDRGDLPIIAISATERIFPNFPNAELSDKEMVDILQSLHKEMASLSNNGRHVIIEGSSHVSIVQREETADHILSLIP